MKSLTEQLDQIRSSFESRAPAEMQATMARAKEEIRQSGLMARLPKVGDPIPHFSLPDIKGRTIHSREWQDMGPMIVTFYRGLW